MTASQGETDYARLNSMTNDDIAKAVAADPDAPPLDVDWDKANIVIPPARTSSRCGSTATCSTTSAPKAKATRPLSTRSCGPHCEDQIKRGRLTLPAN